MALYPRRLYWGSVDEGDGLELIDIGEEASRLFLYIVLGFWAEIGVTGSGLTNAVLILSTSGRLLVAAVEPRTMVLTRLLRKW